MICVVNRIVKKGIQGMINFLVSVTCALHMTNCPIPGGFKAVHAAPSKVECVHKARDRIQQLGFATADFNVVCREK